MGWRRQCTYIQHTCCDTKRSPIVRGGVRIDGPVTAHGYPLAPLLFIADHTPCSFCLLSLCQYICAGTSGFAVAANHNDNPGFDPCSGLRSHTRERKEREPSMEPPNERKRPYVISQSNGSGVCILHVTMDRTILWLFPSPNALFSQTA